MSNNHLNHIDEDGFAFRHVLIDLDLSYNELAALCEKTFHSLRALLSLGLSFNKLSFLPENIFAKCAILPFLHPDNNLLIFFPIRPQLPASLQILSLSNNRMENLDVLNGSFPSLYSLDVIGDKQLETIYNHTFVRLPQLTYLAVSNRSLSHLDEDSFLYNRHLDYLLLANNNLALDFSADYFRRGAAFRHFRGAESCGLVKFHPPSIFRRMVSDLQSLLI